jgi:hypothetical protein
MKYVVLYEAVPTNFVSSFLELYFIFYEFSILKNELVQKAKKKLTGVASSSREPHAIAARQLRDEGEQRGRAPESAR